MPGKRHSTVINNIMKNFAYVAVIEDKKVKITKFKLIPLFKGEKFLIEVNEFIDAPLFPMLKVKMSTMVTKGDTRLTLTKNDCILITRAHCMDNIAHYKKLRKRNARILNQLEKCYGKEKQKSKKDKKSKK